MSVMLADPGAKLASVTIRPMMIGVAIDDRLPMKLNIPPVSPMSRVGARAETSDQVMDANPLPKNAIDRKTMTRVVDSVKLAPSMAVVSSRPVMIGPLRATLKLRPRRSRKSEKAPENRTPIRAAMHGSEARNPDLM